MNYRQYEHVNKNISSEMFYSLMSILHEKLPCAKNFYRLRNNYRRKDPKYQQALQENSSPIRTIASPKLIRGLSITKQSAMEGKESRQSHSPDVRIKSSKNPQNIVRKLSSKNSFEQSFTQAYAQNGHFLQDMNVNLANQNNNFNKTSNSSKMGQMSPNPQFQFLNRQSTVGNGQPPSSPHKLNKIHKFTRYEENKQESALGNYRGTNKQNSTF